MNNRTEELIAIMRDENLNCAAVGKMLERKTRTVRIWRCKDDKRTIPEAMLKLLRFEIAAKKGIDDQAVS